MTGDIVFTVNNGIVSATSPLTASFASSSKTIEKVLVEDERGSFSAVRETIGTNTTYKYRENNGNYRDITANELSKIEEYFNDEYFIDTNTTPILIYDYSVEGENDVINTEDIIYSTDGGFAITEYVITARAVSEAVTATVQAIDSSASYIEFNGVTSIQTSQSITIPTQNNNS